MKKLELRAHENRDIRKNMEYNYDLVKMINKELRSKNEQKFIANTNNDNRQVSKKKKMIIFIFKINLKI